MEVLGKRNIEEALPAGLDSYLPPQEVLSDSEICGGSLIWLHSMEEVLFSLSTLL